MSKHYRKEHDCLNCGKDVDGKFCSNCGQENIYVNETFWAFVSHGVGHYFHYDSKFKKTLKTFLTKPGQLTRDHIEGRRARHISPISLYLFITLVYFLCAPIFKKNKDNSTEYNYEEKTGNLRDSEDRAELLELEEDSISTAFQNYSHDRQLKEIAKLDSQIRSETGLSNESKTDLLKRLKRLNRLNLSAGDSTIGAYRRRQEALPESNRDTWYDSFWKEQKIAYKNDTGKVGTIGEIMDKYFPKMLFILMPIFAFFLMLNFRKDKKLYMEHLIFTIHLFSFAFLSFLISEFLIYLTPSIIGDAISFVSSSILVWYTYRSIRVVYVRSRWVTVRKLFSVSILFLMAFVITYMLGMLTLFAFN